MPSEDLGPNIEEVDFKNHEYSIEDETFFFVRRAKYKGKVEKYEESNVGRVVTISEGTITNGEV